VVCENITSARNPRATGHSRTRCLPLVHRPCRPVVNFTRLASHLARRSPYVSPYSALVNAAAVTSQLLVLQLLDTPHLALSTAPTPCLPLEWPVSVADCNKATTRNVQAFIAADIRASRLLFITTSILPCTLTVPGRSFCCPGTRSSMGTRTPGYSLTGLINNKLLSYSLSI